MLYVHDDVAQAEEVLRVQRLSEEVGKVVVRVDERHAKPMVLDALADVEVTPVHVLGLRVVLGVVCEVARRLVVEAQVDGRVVVPVELTEEGAQVDRLLGCLGGRHMISASQEDSATDDCFLEAHELHAWLHMKT